MTTQKAISVLRKVQSTGNTIEQEIDAHAAMKQLLAWSKQWSDRKSQILEPDVTPTFNDGVRDDVRQIALNLEGGYGAVAVMARQVLHLLA